MKRVVFVGMLAGLAGGLFGFLQSVEAAPTAAPVTLAWNPASDSTVKGYAIYYGPTNQPATNRIDAGTNTLATIFNMQADVTYRIYAVSYNSQGVESIPSNQVLVKQGVIAGLKIAKQANGNMKLTYAAAPGTTGRVQYASKPTGVTWQTLGTTTNDANGNGSMVDATAGQANSRFYRIAVP